MPRGGRMRLLLSLRNRLALVFFGVTFVAIAALYLYVAPGLQSRLMGEKLSQLATTARGRSGDIRATVGSAVAASTSRRSCIGVLTRMRGAESRCRASAISA